MSDLGEFRFVVMDQEDGDVIVGGSQALGGTMEERRPLTLLQIPGRSANASITSSLSSSATDLLTPPSYDPRKTARALGLNGRLAFAIAAAALGSSFQHGYNIGVINAPAKLIMNWINETHVNRTGEALTEGGVTFIWSWAVSIYCIGGMVGGGLSGYFAERFGRKGGLLINNIFAVIAAILMGFSKMADSYEMIIAGRFFIGVNNGLNAGLGPMYLAEISPVHLRGAVGTVYQLVVTISILVSQILGMDVILGTESLWPLLLGLTICPVLFQLATMPLCPESPKYTLLNRGKEIEAQRALTWLRGTLEVHDEMDEMRAEYEAMKLVPKVTLKEIVTNPSLRAPLVIAMMMMMSQQFSGINAVFFFSSSMFESAKLSPDESQYATLSIGAINVVMTIVSLILVEKAGRKTLHLIGLSGMLIINVLLTACMALINTYAWLAYASILLLILFVIMFATGPGSIPWFLVSELFSQSARPMATSIAVTTNWTANFFVGLGFLPLTMVLGPYVFLIFAGLLVVFVLFTIFKVPETKNKTIEEISAMFRQQSYQ